MPGLIVALMPMPLMYWPRTEAGFMFVTWWMKACDVLHQLRGVETQLAHHGVHVAAGVVAELHLARLVLADHCPRRA